MTRRPPPPLPIWLAMPKSFAISTSIRSAMPAALPPSLWNSYKDTLHTTLFHATLDRLLHRGRRGKT